MRRESKEPLDYWSEPRRRRGSVAQLILGAVLWGVVLSLIVWYVFEFVMMPR